MTAPPNARETPGGESWAGRIRPHIVGAVENIIAAGQELLAAKEALPHGQFGPLLAELGLSRQMANRFMRVATNDVIVNRSLVGGLPASVSVLDVLTQLDDDVLVEAIGDGRVSPSTTRQQAAGLADLHRHEATIEAGLADICEMTGWPRQQALDAVFARFPVLLEVTS